MASLRWLFRGPAPAPVPLPSRVPDADAVRRAALQASWQRDRRLGRRRVVWRWIVWGVTRILVPAALLAAAAFALFEHLRTPTPPPADSLLAAQPPRAAEVPAAPVPPRALPSAPQSDFAGPPPTPAATPDTASADAFGSASAQRQAFAPPALRLDWSGPAAITRPAGRPASAPASSTPTDRRLPGKEP